MTLAKSEQAPRPRRMRAVLFVLIMGAVIVFIIGLTAALIYNSAKPARHESKAVAPGVSVTTFTALDAQSAFPFGLAAAQDGAQYLTLFGNGSVAKVDATGYPTTWIAPGASLKAVGAAVFGPDNALYVIDYSAPSLESFGKIKRITSDGKVESFGVTPHGVDLSLFAQMAFDGHGNLYVTSPSTAEVWQIAPGGTSRVWWAAPAVGSAGAQPTGIAYDASRQAMVIGDAGTGTIYRIAMPSNDNAGETVVLHRTTDEEVQAITLDDQSRVLYTVWVHDIGQVNRLENDGKVTLLADGFRQPSAILYRDHKAYVVNSDLIGITPPIFGIIPSPLRARPPFTEDVVTLDG